MDATAAFVRAIRIAGSECKLAAATGFSQVAINKAKRRGCVSPKMALAVHRFTGGGGPASAVRPPLLGGPPKLPVLVLAILAAPASPSTPPRRPPRHPSPRFPSPPLP